MSENAATSRADDTAPVVLLHGVGLDRTMWDAVRRLLPRDAVALDLPGHGGELPLRSAATLDELAEDVQVRMPEGKVHLVGFSLGALIAQHIARYRPEQVATLTCVSAVCRRTPEEAAAVSTRLEIAREDFPASVAASIERWYPEGTTVSAATVEATRRVLLANDRDSYLHAYEVFATADAVIAPELERIVAPTLAVTGELDPGSTPEMSRRLAAAVPDARVVIVPGARHMLPVEDASALAAAITAFIDETQKVEASA